MKRKRYEDDVVIFSAIDSDGKVFFRKEVPTRRYFRLRSGVAEWKTKGRGFLKFTVFAPRDLVLKGVFATTPNLTLSLPKWKGTPIGSMQNVRLKKLEGVNFEYKTKTVLSLS